MSAEYAFQVTLARTLGLRYREHREQAEVVIVNERDAARQKIRREILKAELRGMDMAAKAALVSTTPREQYAKYKAGEG